MEQIAQILGILGMFACVLSYQCKSNSKYYLCQGTSAVFFSIQFVLLGGWAGLVFNVFNIFRAIVCEGFKKTGKWFRIILLEILVVIAALISLFVFKETWWLVLLVIIAQATGTFAMCTRNGKAIRVAQLAVVSPFWLLYDLLIPIPSIGGILCEVFNMVSVIVSFVRFKKTGFDKS